MDTVKLETQENIPDKVLENESFFGKQGYLKIEPEEKQRNSKSVGDKSESAGFQVQSTSSFVHKSGQKQFACNICDKRFNVSSQLEIHMMILHPSIREKVYSCTVCEMKFGSANDLKKHMKAHTGERPYSCNICERKFDQEADLKSHINKHTREKPHSCTVCTMKFYTASDLKRHTRTHTGERPYSCTVCEMKFTRPCNLKNHMRKHTGEKPYSSTINVENGEAAGLVPEKKKISGSLDQVITPDIEHSGDTISEDSLRSMSHAGINEHDEEVIEPANNTW